MSASADTASPARLFGWFATTYRLALFSHSLIGIVTGTDLPEALGTADDAGTLPRAEVMSSPVRTTTPAASAVSAMETMHEHNIARLVVVYNGELRGLLSTDDIIRYVPQIFRREKLDTSPPEEPQYNIHKGTACEKPDWEVKSAGLPDDEVNVGDQIEFTKTVGEQDVRTFAAASGETNRLHLDEEFAKRLASADGSHTEHS